VPACVVGLILGGKVEGALLQTYQISGGWQLNYFLGRPIAIVLFLLLLFSLFSRPIMQWWRQRKAASDNGMQDSAVKSI
jgi:TctA family transporter